MRFTKYWRKKKLQPDKVHTIYFLGIGGIGMSALARYFHAKGKLVAGYDLTPSPLTHTLQQSGIDIHYEAAVENIPDTFFDKETTLVIRTPAVPDDHPELIYFVKKGFEIRKRAEVLGSIFNTHRGIAIAGTHGKTSVTSMTAFILSKTEKGCNAFLGGIIKNLGSNLILNENSPLIVAEADEYDHSFLQLYPDIALVTWIDADHLDIYVSKEKIKESFLQFLDQVKPGGTIILKKSIDISFKWQDKKLYTYSLDDTEADYYATNIRLEQAHYIFDIVTPDDIIKNVYLLYPGLTNVENAVAAAAAAYSSGADVSTIAESLTVFSGVERRFDIRYDSPGCTYIDDYAHHPRELDAFIGSVRKLYPGRDITGIFQPHLYSRTRDFADDFAKSLSVLDELILLDIYPAREKPIEGVSSEIIYKKVTLNRKTLCRKQELLELLRPKTLDILLTMGAGDIDRFVEPIKELIAAR